MGGRLLHLFSNEMGRVTASDEVQGEHQIPRSPHPSRKTADDYETRKNIDLGTDLQIRGVKMSIIARHEVPWQSW